MARIRRWLLLFRRWLITEELEQWYIYQAECNVMGRITSNHTVIAEDHKQHLWYHPDGSCDVVLTSGKQSVAIHMPNGRDWIVVGNESAARAHYDTGPMYRMQNAQMDRLLDQWLRL